MFDCPQGAEYGIIEREKTKEGEYFAEVHRASD